MYPSHRRGRTLAGDLTVLLLVVLFAWLGVRVHDAVADLATLGRGLQQAGTTVGSTARDAAGAIRNGFGAAAGAAGSAPVIGGSLAGALRDAGNSAAAPLQREGQAQAQRLIAAGRDGEQQALDTARLLGWLTFLIPTLLLVSRWAPQRVRQIRARAAARRVLRGGDPAREAELARRAAYSLPYGVLLRHTPDPIGDLLAGRHERLLAALREET